MIDPNILEKAAAEQTHLQPVNTSLELISGILESRVMKPLSMTLRWESGQISGRKFMDSTLPFS